MTCAFTCYSVASRGTGPYQQDHLWSGEESSTVHVAGGGGTSDCLHWQAQDLCQGQHQRRESEEIPWCCKLQTMIFICPEPSFYAPPPPPPLLTDCCPKEVDRIWWKCHRDGHTPHSEGVSTEGPLQQHHHERAVLGWEVGRAPDTQGYCQGSCAIHCTCTCMYMYMYNMQLWHSLFCNDYFLLCPRSMIASWRERLWSWWTGKQTWLWGKWRTQL